jgi:hypothetical protein
MRAAVKYASLVMSLLVTQCGVPSTPSAAKPSGERVSRAAVEERFAVKYCYRQYTNQTDVNYCLLRTAPPPQRDS